MSKHLFTVKLNPDYAAELLKNNGFADFIYEDAINIDGFKKVIVLVFEKYFMRVEGRAGVTVIIENSSGETNVKVITAGVGKGMIFGFDWGASDRMIDDVRSCFSDSIISESELD